MLGLLTEMPDGSCSSVIAVEALKTVFGPDSVLYQRVIRAELEERAYIFNYVSDSFVPVPLTLICVPIAG